MILKQNDKILLKNWFLTIEKLSKMLNISIHQIKKNRRLLRQQYAIKYNRNYKDSTRKAWSLDEVLYIEQNINSPQTSYNTGYLKNRTFNDINQKKYHLKKCGGHFNRLVNDINCIDRIKVYKTKNYLLNNDVSNLTVTQISKKINIPCRNVYGYLQKFNKKFKKAPNGGPLKNEKLFKIYSDLAKKHTIVETAIIMNKDYSTIRKYSKKYNLTFKRHIK